MAGGLNMSHQTSWLIAAVSCLALLASACTKQSGSATVVKDSQETAASRNAHTVVGSVPPPSTGASVIVFLQTRSAIAFPPATETAVMDQVSKQFVPALLFVRNGQRVEFKNSDDELHNVNIKDSASNAQAFNVGIPTAGTYQYTFERDGVYNLTCDVHADMSATIVVTSTPYARLANGDGTFAFADVVPGAYMFTAYTSKGVIQQPVDVSEPRTVIRADVTQ
jgi:plastocyanin